MTTRAIDIAELFAEMMHKHFGATVVTCPPPTPLEIAAMERAEACAASMSTADLKALWDQGVEGHELLSCDDVWSELVSRGEGDYCAI